MTNRKRDALMTIIDEDDSHIAEYFGGGLFITEKKTSQYCLIRLTNPKGNCIAREKFRDAIQTLGFSRACGIFKDLAARQDAARKARTDRRQRVDAALNLLRKAADIMSIERDELANVATSERCVEIDDWIAHAAALMAQEGD